VTATSLNQTQIGSASFAVDVPPLSVTQRLELKGLFQKLGIATQSGKESDAAAVFLARLLELGGAAGGEPPMPECPDTQPTRALQSLGGNAQLLAIHGQKDGLTADVASWTVIKDKIAKKKPRWERLCELQELAAGLPESLEVRASIDGLRASRALLHEPDAVPPLILKLLDSLRKALNAWQAELDAASERETGRLEENPAWQRLTESQREQLVTQFHLRPPAKVKVTTEEDIVAALRENSLANRRTLLDALPQRFQRAIEEAARLLEPKITRVELPSATIRNSEDLEKWLAEARSRIANQLSKGPVMV
jgi:hypothetical protein